MISSYSLADCQITIEYSHPQTGALQRTVKLPKNQSVVIEDDMDAKHPVLHLPHKPRDLRLTIQPINAQNQAAAYTLYSNFAAEGKFSIKLPMQPSHIQYYIQYNGDDRAMLASVVRILKERRRPPPSRSPLKDRTNHMQSTSKLHASPSPVKPGIRAQSAMSRVQPGAGSGALSLASARSAALNSVSGAQRTVLDLVYRERSVFFTGAAGSGKSFILQQLIKTLDSKTTSATSTTGITCSALQGSTIYSWSGISSCSQPVTEQVTRVLRNRELLTRWRTTRTLIIDEISLLDGELFDRLDHIGRTVRQNQSQPFGGIQLVLCGDFLQLPPVNKQSEQPKKFAFEAACWSTAVQHCVELSVVYRQRDQTFITLLNGIRLGQVTADALTVLQSRNRAVLDISDGIEPTMLMVRTADVDRINQEKINALTTGANAQSLVRLLSKDSGSSELLTQSLPQIKPVLELCVGAQVILLRNLDVSAGLCNGSRGVIVKFTATNHPVVRFANEQQVTIVPQPFAIMQNNVSVAVREQVPLQVGYALSVHRSQGMSLDKAIIDLSGTFEFGMVYVALSRLRSLAGLQLRNFESRYVKAHPTVLHFYQTLVSLGEDSNTHQDGMQVQLTSFKPAGSATPQRKPARVQSALAATTSNTTSPSGWAQAAAMGVPSSPPTRKAPRLPAQASPTASPSRSKHRSATASPTGWSVVGRTGSSSGMPQRSPMRSPDDTGRKDSKRQYLLSIR